jgi:hypothetical protein
MMKLSALLLMAAMLLPLKASADFSCQATVINVLVYNNGIVNIVHSGRGDYTAICSMASDYNGVSVTTCAMWTAMLQAIKKKNGTATFYYPGTGTCATLPTYWSTPAPVYIGDVTP